MDTMVKERDDVITVTRNELKEIVSEAIDGIFEDIVLMRAIDEGKQSQDIPVDEFLQREKGRIKELEAAE